MTKNFCERKVTHWRDWFTLVFSIICTVKDVCVEVIHLRRHYNNYLPNEGCKKFRTGNHKPMVKEGRRQEISSIAFILPQLLFLCSFLAFGHKTCFCIYDACSAWRQEKRENNGVQSPLLVPPSHVTRRRARNILSLAGESCSTRMSST